MELLNDTAGNAIETVFSLIIVNALCLFGIVFNAINIVVFFKQGLCDTINISMFSLAVSELCGLVTLLWININLNQYMQRADVPYDPFEMQHLIGNLPHACFLQITIWITIYVTAERFVCIALPLKVKQIFTPLRTKVFISLIYLLMFLALSPQYVTYYYGAKFYPAINQTRIGLKVRDSAPNFDHFMVILFAVLKLIAFIVLSVFTCLLLVALKKRLRWRNKSIVDDDKSHVISRRDARTMKMVGLVAGVLIVCSTPGVCLSLIYFGLFGSYMKTFQAFWTFAFLTEAFNATVNVLSFYKMSSKYRHTLHTLMSACKTRCHGDVTTK